MQVARGEFVLDADVSVADGETVAVLGPERVGQVDAPRDGRRAAGAGPRAHRDRRAGGRRHRRRHRRGRPSTGRSGSSSRTTSSSPTSPALDNVAFGLRARGVARAEARRRAGEWLERLGVGHRAGARPRSLSGGEAQRVALARALAIEPDVLLLDEPLSALDVETRDRVRGELRTHLAGFAGPRVVVTHDPVEAMVLADRLVVLEAGRVTHDGTPAELTRHPRSPYVARLVGLNLYRGTGTGIRAHHRRRRPHRRGGGRAGARSGRRHRPPAGGVAAPAPARGHAPQRVDRHASPASTRAASGCGWRCGASRRSWPRSPPRRWPTCGWRRATRCGCR